MSRILTVSFLFFLLIFHAGAQSEKLIVGDSLPTSGSMRAYSVSAMLSSIEWAVIPRSAGTIVSLKNDSTVIQWAAHSGETPRICTLAVMITYPNADQSYNYFKVVQIQPTIQKKSLNPDINKLFSKLSKDSLRFFFEVQCDSSRSSRRIIFSDSSIAKKDYTTVNWQIVDTKNEKSLMGSGAHYTTELSFGKYNITMEKIKGNASYSVTDTLTLYPPPAPSFTGSTQTPCNGSAITFSNTSKNNQYVVSSIFNTGDGQTLMNTPPASVFEYAYQSDDLMMQINMSRLDLKDLHGCVWQSKELPIAVQQNKFTRFNIGVDPRQANITFAGEVITIECKKGPQSTLPNPETPYTYLWSTGQKTAQIKVRSPGLYTVVVKDRLGCVSPVIGPAEVKQTYRSATKPVLAGEQQTKAGEKIIFRIKPEKDVYYQFKFIYNKEQSFITEPSKQTEIELPNWQQSKAGLLQVIGITIKGKTGAITSNFSDTLNVRITE